MGDATKIQWTDATWNPTVGCDKVSPGCAHCYAERDAKRLQAMGTRGYDGVVDGQGRWTGRLNVVESALATPLKWQRPRRIFVNSMSDLFHEGAKAAVVAEVFATMWAAQWHTFQILTKRPERMASLTSNPRLPVAVGVRAWSRMEPEKQAVLSQEEVIADVMESWPLPNVWLGTSVEDQQRADERIPHLLRCPAAVRFLSCEPLLGPVDLSGIGSVACPVHWVIAGGESGPRARFCDIDWIRDLRDQCRDSGVPIFIKQVGSRVGISVRERIGCQEQTTVYPRGCGFWRGDRDAWIVTMRDRKGGDPSEWPEDLRVRAFPATLDLAKETQE